jgi:fatty acid-binding protein DegV
MMNAERKRVAIVADSGASVHPKSPEVLVDNVTVIPLEITFFENGRYISLPDSEVSPADFYRRMKESKKLPKTSAAPLGKVIETFAGLSETSDSIACTGD